MTWPSYSSRKASGVEWLGLVPSHWDVRQLKWNSPVRRGASPRPIDDPKYFDDDGNWSWVRIADVSASDGLLKETKQRLSQLGSSLSVKLEPGSLFVSIAGTVGKPCITDIPACIHDGFVYFPSLDLNPQYLFRIFEAGECYKGLGKFGTQLNLNTDTIGSIRMPIPPASEQETIVEFLDVETAKIDALIAKQEQLIFTLREDRRAQLINLVAHGCVASTPLKPSGLGWVSAVPVHWTVLNIRRVATMKTGHTPSRSTADYWDNTTIPWFTLADVWQLRDGLRTYLGETKDKISELGLANSAAELLPEGTVVLSRTASVGFSGIMARPMATSQDFWNWVCGPRLLPEYLTSIHRLGVGVVSTSIVRVGCG